MREQLQQLMDKWTERSKQLYPHGGHDKLVALELELCRAQLWLLLNSNEGK